MSKPLKRTSCQIDSVLVGAVIGFLAFVMLTVLGEWSFMQAGFGAGFVFAAAAAALLFFLCKPLPPLEQIQKARDQHTAQPAPTPAKAVVTAVTAAEPLLPPAEPVPPAAVAPTEPVAAVRNGTLLAGEKELATRKGEWTYRAPDATSPQAEPKPVTGANTGDAAAKPQVLQAARGGKADDLKLIKGVGPKLELMLHDMGFFHFDQIAVWSDAELAWVDENLTGFRGRASRDGWVEQARALAAGDASATSGNS